MKNIFLIMDTNLKYIKCNKVKFKEGSQQKVTEI
jgi:hypothetical protein